MRLNLLLGRPGKMNSVQPDVGGKDKRFVFTE
jgi:hypothetical protein